MARHPGIAPDNAAILPAKSTLAATGAEATNPQAGRQQPQRKLSRPRNPACTPAGALVAALYFLGDWKIADAAAADSYCTAGATWGSGLCAGEILLKANYVEVGIHRAGSYGTTSNAPAPFQASKVSDKRLGFMADYGKDGWNVGTPPYAGDYFVPGTPVEGWLVQSAVGSSVTRMVNKGLMTSAYGSNYYVANYGASGTMPTTAMHITSDNERQSMFWVGQYGNLEVRFNVVFGNNDLFFTTSVTLRNIGSAQLKDVYYMRNVDPDQEQPHTGYFQTRNWVQYQPFKDGDPTGFVNDSDPNLALVLARGRTYADLLCGLGTSHPNARVSFYGYDNNDPVAAYAANSGTYGQWRNYGGKNVGPSDTSRQHYADEGINLAFYFPTLDVGATAEFDFAYVLEANDLSVAMDSLKAVKIRQPTDIISGSYVLIAIEISEEIGEVDHISYAIYAQLTGEAAPRWHGISNISYSTPEDALNDFSASFDSLDFSPAKQDVHLKVEVYEKGTGKKYVKLKPASINNVGPQMCFDVPNPDNTAFYLGSTNPLMLIPCDGYTGPLPTKVQFYRELYLLGNSYSELIKTDTTSGDGFSVDIFVDDLPKGLQIVVKAKSTLGSDITTTTVTGTVSELNSAPSSITLSNSVVAEHSPVPTTVGTFTVKDPNANDVHTLTLTNDAGGKFALSGMTLVVNGDIDFGETATLQIEVFASDGQSSNCCLTRQFTITVQNVNEQPGPFTPTWVNVEEDLAVNSVIASFAGTDPDGDELTFSVMGDKSRFDFSGNSLVLKKSLNFEAEPAHVLTVRASDNGCPALFRDQSFTVNVIDVKEAPLFHVIGDASISEASQVGDLVAVSGNRSLVLQAFDEDGEELTLSITTPGVPFELQPLPDAPSVAYVASTAALNYEAKPSYSVTVQASDGELATARTFVISVLNANDAPVLNDKACSMFASSEADTDVCAFIATDQDSVVTAWGQHDCSVVSAVYHGTGGDENAASFFDVAVANNLCTLQLTQSLVVDENTNRFAVGQTIDVTVLVTDGGGLSVTAVMTITVKP